MRVNATEPRATLSVRPRDINVEFLHCRANAANDFGGPERLAQERDPAVFRLAHGTKSITSVRRLIGVEAPARQVLLQVGVAVLRRAAGADTEGLALEALKKFFNLRFAGLREDQTALGCFAIVNLVKLAEFADAFEMTKEIDDKEFVGGESGKDTSPN